MADEKGSVGPKPPIILLEWDFRFWDVRKDADSFGERQINRGGYENTKVTSEVSLDGGSKTVKVHFCKFEGIGALTADHRGKTVTLVLVPPAGHDSGGPADPDSDSPRASAKWNSFFEIQMRKLLFKDRAIDDDGYFKVDGAKFDLIPCHVDKTDADNGLAPHGHARIHRRAFSKKDKQDVQKIEVDWLYDVFRPTPARLCNAAAVKKHYKGDRAKMAADPDGKKKVWEDDKVYDRGKFSDPYLVIHITTGNRFESQLQQLTTGAAIHYLVCLNGHVVKIVEDSKGCYHAGWKKGFLAGWRDYVFGGTFNANRTSIGIEHLGTATAKWPEEEIAGSIRIAKRICAAHGIPPCAVIRHRDLAVKKGLHVTGKLCPGTAVPWARYQDDGVTLWPMGVREGETEPTFPTGDAFFHGIFDLVTFIDDKLSGAEKTPENVAKQKAAIRELKGYLTLIGHWVIKKNKSNEDIYDDSAKDCVDMCQEKFMIARGKKPKRAGECDRETAKVIYAVCQHSDPVLPPLQTR